MKRVLLNILLVVMLSILAISAIGCNGVGETAGGAVLGVHDTLTPIFNCHGAGETSNERGDDQARQLRLNGSMLIDDIDAIFQQDRPSRLTEYGVR